MWGDLYNSLERDGEQRYHIFKAICKHSGTILGNQNHKLICKMDLKKKKKRKTKQIAIRRNWKKKRSSLHWAAYMMTKLSLNLLYIDSLF